MALGRSFESAIWAVAPQALTATTSDNSGSFVRIQSAGNGREGGGDGGI